MVGWMRWFGNAFGCVRVPDFVVVAGRSGNSCPVPLGLKRGWVVCALALALAGSVNLEAGGQEPMPAPQSEGTEVVSEVLAFGRTSEPRSFELGTIGIVRGRYSLSYERTSDEGPAYHFGGSFSPGLRFLPDDGDRLKFFELAGGMRSYSSQGATAWFTGVTLALSITDGVDAFRSHTGGQEQFAIRGREVSVKFPVGRRVDLGKLMLRYGLQLVITRSDWESGDAAIPRRDLPLWFEDGVSVRPGGFVSLGYRF